MSLTFSETLCWCLVGDKVSSCVIGVNAICFEVTSCHKYPKFWLDLFVY